MSVLSRPLVSAMRPLEALPSTASIGRVATYLREQGVSVAPIAGDDGLVRFLTDRHLADALANGIDAYAPASPLADAHGAPLIYGHETGASALRRLVETGQSTLIVIDPSGGVIGAITAADLVDKPAVMARPPQIGGMATPFGVYLTTGNVRAGAEPYALASTGAMLATLLIVGTLVGDQVGQFGFRNAWPAWTAGFALNILPTLVFMVGLRMIPLAGIHAAEHMTVHAIERGEPLTLEVVRRMPRVHPRCGTNLAVAASIFLGISSAPWIADQELRLIAAVVAALVLRQPLGSLMQAWVTTRKPSDKQLMMGIQSGRDLLNRYQFASRMPASITKRLWSSGIQWVILGSSAVVTAAYFLGIA